MTAPAHEPATPGNDPATPGDTSSPFDEYGNRRHYSAIKPILSLIGLGLLLLLLCGSPGSTYVAEQEESLACSAILFNDRNPVDSTSACLAFRDTALARALLVAIPTTALITVTLAPRRRHDYPS